MSSFGGTNLNGIPEDPGLQEAPEGEKGPDFGTLKKAFEDCISNLQPYVEQCQDNFNTRYAIWNNQSSDGRKHAREGSKIDPTPWDGASDLRVFLVDEAINSKIAMLCMAFSKAAITAVPVEGNDIKRAKVVSSFMKWLVQTQIPEIAREVELLSNYIQEKGIGATGQFWESTQERVLTTVTIEELTAMLQQLVQAQMPQQPQQPDQPQQPQQPQPPQIDAPALLQDPATSGSIGAIFEEIYGCTRSKSKKMIAQLLDEGVTTVSTLGKMTSRPVVRAFNLDEDLFIPQFSTDLETAPAIYRIQYFSPEKLRSLVNSDGWDESWVEEAIEKCRGKLLNIAQSDYNKVNSRSLIFSQQIMTDLVGVVYAYQRLSDSEGVPGIYLTIFHPDLPASISHEGYAKYGLLGYAHGQYPFVLHRREYLSRRLHDSRGVPEPGKPIQDQIKVHKDSRVDAASIAIMPPMGYPSGRPPLKWGAAARLPERRPGEYHFLDHPRPDGNTDLSEQMLRSDFNQYNGFPSKDGDPQFAAMKNQFEVDKFMASWSSAFRQIWSLYQQYGSEQVYFRVVGLRQIDAIDFRKGAQGEEFDFVLSFRVDSMDSEATYKKLEQIAKIVATANRDGIVDYSEWMQVMIESVDPVIAERILLPREQGQQKVVGEIQDMLAKVYAGQDQDIKLGTPPELGLNVIQNYLQGDPVVQKRMQDKDDPFGKRIEKIAKQLQFQITQKGNAQIGRLGA